MWLREYKHRLRGLDEAVSTVLEDPSAKALPKRVWRMLWLLRERRGSTCEWYDVPDDLANIVMEYVTALHGDHDLNISMYVSYKVNTMTRPFRENIPLPHPRCRRLNVAVMCFNDAHEQAAVSSGFTPIMSDTLYGMARRKKAIKKLIKPFDKLLCPDTSIRMIPRMMGPTLPRLGKFPSAFTTVDNMVEKYDALIRTAEYNSRKSGFLIGHTGLPYRALKENVVTALEALLPHVDRRFLPNLKIGLQTTFGRYQPLITPYKGTPVKFAPKKQTDKPFYSSILYHIVADSLHMVQESIRTLPKSKSHLLSRALEYALAKSDNLEIVKALLFSENIVLNRGSGLVMEALRSQSLVVEKVELLLKSCPSVRICHKCIQYCFATKSPKVMRGFGRIAQLYSRRCFVDCKREAAKLVLRQLGCDNGSAGSWFLLVPMYALFWGCAKKGVSSELGIMIRDMLGTEEETAVVGTWWAAELRRVNRPIHYYDYDDYDEYSSYDYSCEWDEEDGPPLFFRTDRYAKNVMTRPSCSFKKPKIRQPYGRSYRWPYRCRLEANTTCSYKETREVRPTLSYAAALKGEISC
eukprot:TRINITY_DN48122_c0_g1_i1.p1 TRINITY_DN48122_c0_g1~~TRINITY_DN48122_c0_g1_i1.p1  ORF type:complete len:579 (+),score=148.35 TRINITY_DN48122_c0_g1_i1:40-1776(+)